MQQESGYFVAGNNPLLIILLMRVNDCWGTLNPNHGMAWEKQLLETNKKKKKVKQIIKVKKPCVFLHFP